MKICPDTNILLRAVIPINDDGAEDASQSKSAGALLLEAETIFITLSALCEFSWVLRSVYRFGKEEIETVIRLLVDAGNVVCDRRAVAFGLDVLAAGGDFADGVIAEAGFIAGAERFVSFDQRAVRLVATAGRDAVVPT